MRHKAPLCSGQRRALGGFLSESQPPANGTDRTRTSDGRSAQESGAHDLGVPVEQLGDFKLMREIGRGGMGVVYEARQISLNRRVALKVLPPGLGLTQQAVTRFEREARAAAKLHHTNIVPVHAIGKDAGCHYYAMELIEGKSLSELLVELKQDPDHALLQSVPAGQPKERESSSSGTLSDGSTTGRGRFDAVARLTADVAEALDYAHGRGIIHRDIKPANLMLSANSRLCITDFGLARIAQEPGMTVSGSFLGTPAYMSPEQIAAGRIEVDHRTDVYSLGAVLYEMLTLQRPFPGESRDKVLTGIMTKEPVAPRKVNPRVPIDLETICHKAMEKDADRRYQSAGELAHDLRQFLGRGLITARRAGPLRRAAKVVQRHPVVAISVVAVVLLGVLGGVAWHNSQQRTLEALHALVGDARFALSQGAYRDALAKTDRALALDSDLSEARAIRARALIQLYRAPEALREAQLLLEANPDDWIAHAIVVSAARSPSGTYTGDLETHREAVERLAPETAEAYVLRAALADSAGEAMPLLDQAVELDPGDVGALEARAGRHIELLDFQAALADSDRLITAGPRSALGRRVKAMVLLNMNDLEGTLAEIEKAIAFDPDDPVSHFFMHLYHVAMINDAEQGLVHLDRALGLDPQNQLYLERRADLLRDMGRFDESLEIADTLETLDPDSPTALRLRVWAYHRLGDHERFEEALGKIELAAASYADPQRRGDAYAQVRDASVMIEDYGRALAAADRVVAERADDDLGWYWGAYLARARIHLILGDGEAFQADCDRAADIELEQANQLATRAWSLHMQCDRNEEALRDANQAVELAPRWAEAYDVRALMRLVFQDHEGAVADLGEAIELAPGFTLAYGNRQLITHRLGRFEESLRDADALVRLMPGAPRGHTARGEILLSLGRLDESLEAYKRALELAANNAAIRVWTAGGVRAEMPGQCDRVSRELDEALAMDPQNTNLKMQIAGIHVYTLHENCPELYDLPWALAATERELELDPSSEVAQAFYGMALYRAGRYQEALEPLRNASIKFVGWPREKLVLAMALWKLGRETEARSVYDDSAAWMQRTGSAHPIFIRLQRETAGLMGLPLPASG